MTGRFQVLPTLLALTIVLVITLSACKTETIEVTRVKILERRVIERVIVTVEVTRIHRVIETPKPTAIDIIPLSPTAQPSPTQATPTATPTPPRPTVGATAVPTSSAKQSGERLLAAVKESEQTFLPLVQALNSDPLPIADIITLYDTVRSAPTFSIPDSEAELQAIYVRYREQIDYALGQATDLYTHLVKIQSGEAEQTVVSPIHLSLARDAASTGTSTLQGLIRELEILLAALP